MTSRFTGRHMLIVMVAFFGTVIAVNITMAMFATRTFGGTVVDNSYVASQKFNGWLKDARDQDALGWSLALTLGEDRHPVIAAAAGKIPLAGAVVTATAKHPVGRAPDIALTFTEVAPGQFRAVQPLPAGRWNIHMEAAQGGAVLRRIADLS
jgi:nitrogen fixation protein FixH